jgi:cupin 2 domain-containing protein
MKEKNIFSQIPDSEGDEIFETLVKTDSLKLERIISAGQATPHGEWYDQETEEWVLLVKGSAGLLFEGQKEIRVMKPGDYILIEAHQRHRVEWTDPKEKTIWLALHYRQVEKPQ